MSLLVGFYQLLIYYRSFPRTRRRACEIGLYVNEGKINIMILRRKKQMSCQHTMCLMPDVCFLTVYSIVNKELDEKEKFRLIIVTGNRE